MDVTVKEANKMYVHRERMKKDLVCLFLLDLPELCLDITASQFYIGINVIKNVLLAPPPDTNNLISRAKESINVNYQDYGEESEKEDNNAVNKVTELFRDSQLLQQDKDIKNDLKNDLNLKNRTSREEIKALIEDYFNRAFEKKYGMARVVELFIGKGTWILRSPPGFQNTVQGPSLSQSLSHSLSPSYLAGTVKKNTLGGQMYGMYSDKDKEKGLEKGKEKEGGKEGGKDEEKGGEKGGEKGKGGEKDKEKEREKEKEKEREKEREKDPLELLETGFTGVHATFNYNEDR